MDPVSIPCQVDGSPVAATLRGFGHGWQGQHNSTNAVFQAYGYDEYNDTISEELHHSLRAGTRQSNGVLHAVQLFEPMSLREENWTERDVKNALRAEASKSSHAIVSDQGEPVQNIVVRRLTPQECEALMSWPTGWTEFGVNEETGEEVKMADTHRYRMCGNGVVSNVAEWFAIRYEAARRLAEDAE